MAASEQAFDGVHSTPYLLFLYLTRSQRYLLTVSPSLYSDWRLTLSKGAIMLLFPLLFSIFVGLIGLV